MEDVNYCTIGCIIGSVIGALFAGIAIYFTFNVWISLAIIMICLVTGLELGKRKSIRKV